MEPREDRIITASQLDFSAEGSHAVISSAQKFVIPVPQFADGGEPLVHPAGTEKAGQPITDYKGRPIGERGLVFFNGKDQSYQAVKGDGSGVVIMNQVTEAEAAMLTQKVKSLGEPTQLSSSQLKEVLRYAREDLGIVDMYNSDQAFVTSKMTPITTSASGVQGFGLHKRDDRDICRAVFIEGKGKFQGPAATPQQFENGAVIVQQGDSVRLVQPEVFEQTYRQATGEVMKLEDIPRAVVKSSAGAAMGASGQEAPDTKQRPVQEREVAGDADGKKQTRKTGTTGTNRFGRGVGAAAGAASLGMGAVASVEAVREGDVGGALLGGANVAVGSVSVASDIVAATGKNIGAVEGAGRLAGKTALPLAVAMTTYETYKEQGTGADDKYRYKAARATSGAVTAGTGVGIGAAAAALGGGAVSVVGAPLVAAGAIGYAGAETIETSKMYSRGDKALGNVNLMQMSNLNTAQLRLHDKLAAQGAVFDDAGRLDLSNAANRDRLRQGIAETKEKLQEAMERNDSILPRAMRWGKSVVEYTNAKRDLSIFVAAETELKGYEARQQESGVRHARTQADVAARIPGHGAGISSTASDLRGVDVVVPQAVGPSARSKGSPAR